MTEYTAHVPTANAARYMTQLCKHWAHRFEVTVEDRRGSVRFERGSATMTPGDQELVVTVRADDELTAMRLQRVMAEHLDRFAFREAPLTFNWRSAADVI